MNGGKLIMKEVLEGGLRSAYFSAVVAVTVPWGFGRRWANARPAPGRSSAARREGVKRRAGDVTSFT